MTVPAGTSPQAHVVALEGGTGRTRMELGTIPEPVWDLGTAPAVGVSAADAGWPWWVLPPSALCSFEAGFRLEQRETRGTGWCQ